MPTLRFGTSSWSEKSWVGPFYPAGTKPAAMLPFYAQHFDTVEVDSTYYRSPSWDMLRRWHDVTPPGFVLASKMPTECFLGSDDPRQLDPEQVLCGDHQRLGSVISAHLAGITQLKAKAGPVVIQLPWMHRDTFAGREAFLRRLDEYLGYLPRDVRIAVEVRNREYLHDELLDVLRKHGAALVLSEVRGMPPPADVADQLNVLTTGWFYARLIGDRSKVERLTKDRPPAERFGSVVLDQSASLGRWAHLVRTLASSADGFVYANNHYAGYGVETIRQLRALVEAAQDPPQPPTTDPQG